MEIYTSIIKGTREYQQDSICIPKNYSDQSGLIVALCDGMGGMENGDLASSLCSALIVNTFYSDAHVIENIPKYYEEISRIADQKVADIGRQGTGVGTCGTTLVSACIKNNQLYVCSVGDSNILFWRNGSLIRLNTYHNIYTDLQKQLSRNLITQDEFDNYPSKHALTSFIGMNGLKYIDKNTNPITLSQSDMIILCSDGVSGVLSDKEINDICTNTEVSAICTSLIKAILDKKLNQLDNASMVLVRI